jgi:ribosomal-protein-serine acetyltransferase
VTTAKPILLDVASELRSERLFLRAPRAGDGEVIFPSVRESLTELKPWMPWAKDEYSQADAEEWCRRTAAQFLSREQLQFLIFLDDGATHIGNMGLFKFVWDVPSCEIGYWLHTKHVGRGYMTEAVNALTTFAMTTLKTARVQILTDDRNARSYRVAERCGYQLEGILRSDSRTSDSTLRNTRVYSRIA